MRNGVGIRAELNDAEGHASTREGMSHAVRPDDGIDIFHLGIGGASQG